MLNHINYLTSLHAQLVEIGVEIDDKELALTLLASVPNDFMPLLTALDVVVEKNLSFDKSEGGAAK